METNLWEHALFLAKNTNSRTFEQVMIRFTDSLTATNPLQTVYKMMSNHQSAAAAVSLWAR